jgi:hypothetical protein
MLFGLSVTGWGLLLLWRVGLGAAAACCAAAVPLLSQGPHAEAELALSIASGIRKHLLSYG